MKNISIIIIISIILVWVILPKSKTNIEKFEEKVSDEILKNHSDIAGLFAHKVGCDCGCSG